MQCGLLGRKLGHSYSPQIHKRLADYQYDLFEVEPEDLESFLKTAPFQGLNVTIPYKKEVMAYCAALSDTARAIGSVNTLVRQKDGSLYGDNTDADGFAAMLSYSGIDPRGKKALVLGSGGASLAIVYVLKQMGAKQIVVISRSGENHYGNLHLHQDAQLIVNTTPVGMYPDTGVKPVDLRQFPSCEGVLDIIYNPAKTQLLLQAQALGLPHCDGLIMLVGQAKRAAERFTGTLLSESLIPKIMGQLRFEMGNLILIGMPGCGKSTIGQALAQRLGRPFADADAEIERQTGLSIPQIFSRFGEERFRQEETKALQRLGKQSGLVIATGGGCVTRPENYPLLHQNGIVIFLQRDLSELATEGRPLSLASDLQQMYRKRLPLYEQFSDAAVVNQSDAAAVAARIEEVSYEISCTQWA